METRYLSLLMTPGHFWAAEGLLPGWFLGESIRDWAELPAGLPIVLLDKGTPTSGGRVDCVMEDGSAIWIRDEAWSRRLVHRSEGLTIRVAVCRSPSPRPRIHSPTRPQHSSL